MLKFKLPGRLLGKPVKIAVIGAGGSGSQIMTGLAQLHMTMLALGHPHGLDVVVYDDDLVSTSNIGRQMFLPPDVGRAKADVMVNRINMTMGMNWTAQVERLTGGTYLTADLIIGCVDSRAARAAILECAQRSRVALWMDLGNKQHDGQVILGEIPMQFDRADRVRIPTIADLFPETCDPSQDSDDDGPSCSLAEALEKQSLFVNRGVVLYALNMLFELFRYGEISYHGVFVNLKTARSSPLPIDPVAWEKRFGYTTGKQAETPKVAE